MGERGIAMSAEVMKGAEPFFFEGGETGVLVLHGFTGTTQSVRPLGEGLAAEGFTVLGPRLPGHGTDIGDLAGRSWMEWVGEAERGFETLKERCSRVFVTGLSMGGTLTLYLGERRPQEVAGLMPINAAVDMKNPLLLLTPVAKYFLKTVPGVGSDIKDPSQKELCYDRVPVRAAHELLKLTREVRARLHQITAPLLVFVSKQDHVVPPSNGPLIMQRVSSQEKELVWLENSYHVATLDYDCDTVIRRCVEFIRKHAG